MTTHLTAARPGRQPTASAPRSLRSILPGVTAVLFAGVQLQAGVVTVAYRQITTVPADRLNFPYEGTMSVAMSLAWGLAQAGFVLTSSLSPDAGRAEGVARAVSVRVC